MQIKIRLRELQVSVGLKVPKIFYALLRNWIDGDLPFLFTLNNKYNVYPNQKSITYHFNRGI